MPLPRRFNLTHKFTAYLLVASILPLMVVGLVSYSVARSTIREQTARSMQIQVNNQSEYIDLYLQQVNSLISNLAGVEEVVAALGDDTPISAYTNLATQARISYILDGYSGLDGLVSIDVFSQTGRHFHVGDTLNVSNIRPDVKDKIYAQAVQANGKTVWTGIEDNINANSGSGKVITAARTLAQSKSPDLEPKIVGWLVINISVDPLYHHFEADNSADEGTLIVIDEHDRILYHPDRSLLGSIISPQFTRSIGSSAGAFEAAPDGQNVLILYNHSPKSGWTVMSLVPMALLEARTQAILFTNGVAVALAVLLALAAAGLVSQRVVNPLRQLTERFKLFQAGQLGDLPPLPYGSTDEVGELVGWFNVFQDSLKARTQAEAARRESEERYSLAVHGSNDGVWDWDLRTQSIYYSERWKEILGCTEDQIGSSPDEWFSRIHPEDSSLFRDNLDAHLSGQTVYFQSEHRLRMQDGFTYCWVLARGLAVRDENGWALRIAGSLTDISARKSIEERLRHDAMHDSLTGLPNRTYFMHQLHRSIEQAARSPFHRSAVLFLDLDRFKIVNDGLGHAVGDQMLVMISQRLSNCVRPADLVARFGGDEFAILLEETYSVQDATQVAERLQQSLANPLALIDHEIFTTASMGIAMITAASGQADDVLRNADTAMYQAKAHGRACYVVYGEEMHAKSMAVLQMEAMLRRGLDRQEFLLHYQPIVDIRTGAVVAVEALIRWQGPDGELVPPGDFIPLAEETGVIVPVGEWVLRTACAQIREWHLRGQMGLVLSVNISARQLQDHSLPATVHQVLTETGLPGEALLLEITESDAMADLDLTVQILDELKEMGVKVAIDDFGNRYSSLGYLKRFPVSSFKIDKSFIHDLNVDSDAAGIVTAMISMAHVLEVEVIAEGVEDAQQLAFLREQGCKLAQGYFFSRPLPGPELLDLLQQGRPAMPLEAAVSIHGT